MKKLLLFWGGLSLCCTDVFCMHSRRGIAKGKNSRGILSFSRNNKAGQLFPVSDRRLHRGGVIPLNKTHLDKLNKEDLVSLVLQLEQKNESLEQKQEELTQNLKVVQRDNTELFENWKAAQGANKFIVSENDRWRHTAEFLSVALRNQSKSTGQRWLEDENQRQSCIDGILQVINNRELTESCQKFRGNSKCQLMLLTEAVKDSFIFFQRENEVRKRENEVSQSEIAFLKERLSLLEKQLREKNDNPAKAIEDNAHNWITRTKTNSGQENHSEKGIVEDKSHGGFDQDEGANILDVMFNNDEWSSMNSQRDSGEMRSMMSDNDDRMSEQSVSNDATPKKCRTVDLGGDCSYSGDFEGNIIHGMGTFHNGVQAFDISGSFIHGCLDLTKPIKFEGYDGRIRQFQINALSNDELKIEIDVLVTVQSTSCANNSLCLIFSQKQLKKEGVVFNERFIYKGELDDNDRPEGKGVMIRNTGEIRRGNFTKQDWLQE